MLSETSIEQYRRAKEIFFAALDRNASERAAFVREKCAADEQVCREVESLLAAHVDAGGFLESPGIAVVKNDAGDEFIGEIVDNYKITRALGTGGMGAVYLAERVDDFEQRVALKIVKREINSAEIVRRFHRERQILAALEHPNIARLIDGGATRAGVPYLVMEYVEGAPLTEFAERENLSLTARLDLFRRVCAAVEYAHRHLVVHRDLKPSNILVTADGAPKLLDFGIAKLLKTETSRTAEETATRHLAFTPEYASPEQMRGEKLTTATDIYSLAVILYELLTGAKPYRLDSRNVGEALRIVCETEPEPPSSAVSGRRSDDGDQTPIGEQRATYKARQTTDPKSKTRNSKLLKGDLDNIILKALRKEPERRYSSVEQFSEDIRRHLAGLPVTARGDTWSYRAAKFVRRNRAAATLAVMVLLALVGGIAATADQSRRAARQREIAERRFDDVREIARAVIFKYHDEVSKLSGATNVRAMMVSDSLRYLDRLSADEEIAAQAQAPEFRHEIAEAYIRLGNIQGQPYTDNLGDTAGAIESYRKAARLLEPLAAPDEYPAAMQSLANCYENLSRTLRRSDPSGKVEALDLVRRAIALRERVVALLPDDRAARMNLAKAFIVLAEMSPFGAGAGESVQILKDGAAVAEELARRAPDDANYKFLAVQYGIRLSFALYQLGKDRETFWRTDEAAELYRQSLPVFEKSLRAAENLLAAEPNRSVYRSAVFHNKSNMSDALRELGRCEEALPLKLETIAYQKQALANDPASRERKFELAEGWLDIAQIYLCRGEKNAATEHFENGMKLLDEIIEADPQNAEFKNFQIINLQIYYGDTQIKAGDYDGALTSYRRSEEKAARFHRTDPATRASATVFINQRFGDIYRLKAQTALNGTERGKNWTMAREAYRRALTLLTDEYQKAEAARLYLNEKLRECEANSR